MKSRNMFCKSGKNSDGLSSWCNECLKKSPSRSKEYYREYRDNNRDHLRLQTQINKKRRRSEDISFRLEDNLRSRLNCAIRGKNKSARTMELIGCTIEFMIEYLESQFEPLMTWNNYGEWHVDHIIPCANFDFTKEEDQRKCFHYSNLQPLWATSDIAKIYGSTKIGNIEKSDKLI